MILGSEHEQDGTVFQREKPSVKTRRPGLRSGAVPIPRLINGRGMTSYNGSMGPCTFLLVSLRSPKTQTVSSLDQESSHLKPFQRSASSTTRLCIIASALGQPASLPTGVEAVHRQTRLKRQWNKYSQFGHARDEVIVPGGLGSQLPSSSASH